MVLAVTNEPGQCDGDRPRVDAIAVAATRCRVADSRVGAPGRGVRALSGATVAPAPRVVGELAAGEAEDLATEDHRRIVCGVLEGGAACVAVV